MASVLFLFYASFNSFKRRADGVRFWGTASLHCAYIHILLSLAILSSTYYPRFFGTGKMNLMGELTVLFGFRAAYCYWFIRIGFSACKRQMFQLLSCFFVAGHLVAMGFTGWIKVEKWHGGLPPISLVSFVFAILSLILFLRTKDENFC